LDVIEKAIRNAFEKGDADDRAFREKVYRSAFAALEKALQSNQGISPELAEKRRIALQAKIAEIETEFIPAVPAVETPSPRTAGPDLSVVNGAPSVELDDDLGAPAAPPVGPAVEAAGRPASPDDDPVIGIPEPVEPRLSARPSEPRLPEPPADRRAEASTGRVVPEPFFPDVSDFDTTAGPDVPQAEIAEVTAAGGPNVATDRRRPLAAIFLGVTLLALAAIGVWWAISTGLVKMPGPPETDDITHVPPDDEEFTPGEEEAPAKPGELDAERNWILVFSPSDPTTINAPGGTKAEVMSDDTGNFVRIRSSASGSAIVFDVPQGVLEQISGKHATFDVVARAEEGKETQFSVDCNFGELGDCGRKRYRAGYEKGDFLFDLDLPAKEPGAAGTVALNSDVDNGGKAIDVYEIKVSVSE
jgi:hypothetical protein